MTKPLATSSSSHAAPIFFSIEGIDGSGKTTQCGAVREALSKMGVAVTQTREPGGTPAGEKIRSLILSEKVDLSTTAQILLFFAAREQNIQENILPSLSSGTSVVTDRFTLSTIAYQGYGLSNGDPQTLNLIRALDLGMPVRPHITFWLDIPSEVSLKRMEKRCGPSDRFEEKDRSFFHNVREGYRQTWENSGGKITRIDGTLPPPEITKIILDTLQGSILR